MTVCRRLWVWRGHPYQDNDFSRSAISPTKVETLSLVRFEPGEIQLKVSVWGANPPKSVLKHEFLQCRSQSVVPSRRGRATSAANSSFREHAPDCWELGSLLVTTMAGIISIHLDFLFP